MGRAQFAGKVQLVLRQIHRDHLPRPAGNRTQQPGQTNTAQPDYRGPLPDAQFARVQHRPHPGQHRTAQQRRALQGNGFVDLHTRRLGHDGAFGKGRHAQMVVHSVAIHADPSVAADQRTAARGDKGRLAQRRAPLGAWRALPTGPGKDQNDVIARFKGGDMRAHRLDHGRGFVAQRNRHLARAVAVDGGQVRMAQPRRRHAHPHLARPRLPKLCLNDFQRF
ncbi:hypothetical protein ACMU_14310 [Actibacterium mucosum KCTC 23349]|uniref:Uncharacterized protein n=1 Tax=Actibacterium mucosum KCTC 23349 TaxID=1454373 RepID=A0A037ZHE1_9RHOB|nr:hypothetical protein ACMU_14310 [Actibacterium mucosum KCTC 23349]